MLTLRCRCYLAWFLLSDLTLARLRTNEPIEHDRKDLRRDDLERMRRYQ
jgi:hypothetical protein